MHAGLVSFRTEPQDVEEAVRTYRDSVLPTLREQEGFEGTLLLTNPESGEGYAVGLWQSREHAEKFESSGVYQEQVAKLGQTFAEAPTREVYEVSVRA